MQLREVHLGRRDGEGQRGVARAEDALHRKADVAALEYALEDKVIPTPLHVLGRISPIFPRFFPFFARFHRLAEAVPTNRKPEPRAERQWQGRPNTVSPAQLTPGVRNAWEGVSLETVHCHPQTVENMDGENPDFLLFGHLCRLFLGPGFWFGAR